MLAIKRVPLQHSANVALQFEAPAEGKRTLKLFFMCDSYLGCDQEYDIELSVKEALPEEEDDEDEDME